VEELTYVVGGVVDVGLVIVVGGGVEVGCSVVDVRLVNHNNKSNINNTPYNIRQLLHQPQ
jgi:hypothetical protein